MTLREPWIIHPWRAALESIARHSDDPGSRYVARTALDAEAEPSPPETHLPSAQGALRAGGGTPLDVERLRREHGGYPQCAVCMQPQRCLVGSLLDEIARLAATEQAAPPADDRLAAALDPLRVIGAAAHLAYRTHDPAGCIVCPEAEKVRDAALADGERSAGAGGREPSAEDSRAGGRGEAGRPG